MGANAAGVDDGYSPTLKRRPRSRGALDLLGNKSQEPTEVLTHSTPPAQVSRAGPSNVASPPASIVIAHGEQEMESGRSSGSRFSGVPTHTSVNVTCETLYMNGTYTSIRHIPGWECAGEAGILIPVMSRPLSGAEERPQGGCKSGKPNIRANGLKAKTHVCASEKKQSPPFIRSAFNKVPSRHPEYANRNDEATKRSCSLKFPLRAI